MNFLLLSIISSNQSRFVKGRCIIKIALLTQEIVTSIKKRGKSVNVILKLDMTVAYDRVSWLYLTKVLWKNEIFIDLIWRLLTNNWYSILINDQSHGSFHSSRGVKQGDSLFPALFTLASKTLSRALNALLYD